MYGQCIMRHQGTWLHVIYKHLIMLCYTYFCDEVMAKNIAFVLSECNRECFTTLIVKIFIWVGSASLGYCSIFSTLVLHMIRWLGARTWDIHFTSRTYENREKPHSIIMAEMPHGEAIIYLHIIYNIEDNNRCLTTRSAIKYW